MSMKPQKYWRNALHQIIFEADTLAGKAFDIILIAFILMSVAVVMMDSVVRLNTRWGTFFYAAEWFFTILFSLEYLARLICVNKPLKYASSFLGVVDLMAILPTYISLFIPGSRYLMVIRVLRVLRIFRVLKLGYYLGEAGVLIQALYASRRRITVFLFSVVVLVIIFGSLMYLIEGAENGFTSIPRSIYWAVVTMTTVGYGDISPATDGGQTLASLIMILGYGIIAVPTGIVTVELGRVGGQPLSTQVCPACMAEDHDTDAVFCKLCSTRLNPEV